MSDAINYGTSYLFKRVPQLSLGLESTAIRDTSEIKNYLNSIGAYDPERGDVISVHTGGGDISVNLTQKLDPEQRHGLVTCLDPEYPVRYYHEKLI